MKFFDNRFSKALFLVFISVVLTPSLELQAQNNQTSTFIGTWTFDHKVSLNKIKAQLQQHLDSLPQLKQQLLDAYVGRKMSFGPNGEFVQSLADGRSVTGSWNLDPNNVLVLTDSSGSSIKQQFSFNGTNRLVLIPVISGDIQAMIPEWHFIKN
ncbi:lipocalin/fatty acid-binding family protein [Poritiphilus flavus]|uniref:Lipocalin-like domain-containing protein n=1 Tax=Poritiphilus flavus TaxID=2697053 RepID=A0A6L9ED43_9FLAO|nr:hypothetical protein [Poritiphilus flavus]NAS12674.1 hypothetical protein [Poritiphilus flavus]